MTPEEKARIEIDRQLGHCGWHVQDHAAMNLSAGLGIAVREFPLKTGHADYLLYVDGKAAGVVEAKPEGHTLTGVETQSAKYNEGLPSEVPHYRLPLPFAYESTGVETQFTNGLNPVPRSREVFTFHRPEELHRLVQLGDDQLRSQLRNMPELVTTGLWQVQIEAIRSLEQSLADNRPRSLIQMATGSGKTYTACSFAYRLIKFAKAKRILFLVDRNNLGKQALNEFQQFASPYTNYKFTEEFGVQRLTRNSDPARQARSTRSNASSPTATPIPAIHPSRETAVVGRNVKRWMAPIVPPIVPDCPAPIVPMAPIVPIVTNCQAALFHRPNGGSSKFDKKNEGLLPAGGGKPRKTVLWNR